MKYNRAIIFIAVFFSLAFTACTSDSPRDIHGFSAVDHYNFGLNWMQSNELQRAESSFQKAVELDNKFGDAYVQLGLIYYILYEREIKYNIDREVITRYYNQSYNCFQNGLKYSPQNPQAYTGIARLQIIGRQFDKAIANLLKAREVVSPDDISSDVIICYELGNCYLSQGKYRDALSEYKNYLELVPGGPEHDDVSDLVKEIEKKLEGAQPK